MLGNVQGSLKDKKKAKKLAFKCLCLILTICTSAD